MDGVHDLGGVEGFGPVEAEADEPPFHQPWEGRVHGMMLALGAGGHLPPGFRHAIERMDPVHYLTSSYYEHWLEAVVRLLTEAGTITEDDLAGVPAREMPTRADPEAAAFVRSLLRPFPVTDRTEPSPRFRPGDQVRVRRNAPRGHTRCPRYVRGATGTIAQVRSIAPLPDGVATGEHTPEATYSVRFDPSELWGGGAESGRATVRVDLWESYLEAAP